MEKVTKEEKRRGKSVSMSQNINAVSNSEISRKSVFETDYRSLIIKISIYISKSSFIHVPFHLNGGFDTKL